jgi:GH24 family phage-related lysozyme (muramidase)
MQTSQNGFNFLVSNEGTCLTIKPDNKGPQIGHGHDLTPAEQSSKLVYGINISGGITTAQADTILWADLHTVYEPAVNRQAPQANQNQFDALIDFCYNLGLAPLATMLHHGFSQVPVQMPAWCYAEIDGVEQKYPPLEARRQKEVALFNTPVGG